MGQGISAAAILADYGRKLLIVQPIVLNVVLVVAFARALLKRSKSPLRDFIRSPHNAIAVLDARALARAGRGGRIAGWGFAFLILFGSIHLGWHYAVDGVISAVVMLGIWWAVGRYLDRSGYAAAVAGNTDVPLPEAPRPALA